MILDFEIYPRILLRLNSNVCTCSLYYHFQQDRIRETKRQKCDDRSEQVLQGIRPQQEQVQPGVHDTMRKLQMYRAEPLHL